MEVGYRRVELDLSKEGAMAGEGGTEQVDRVPIAAPVSQVADRLKLKIEAKDFVSCRVEKTKTEWVITTRLALPR